MDLAVGNAVLHWCCGRQLLPQAVLLLASADVAKLDYNCSMLMLAMAVVAVYMFLLAATLLKTILHFVDLVAARWVLV